MSVSCAICMGSYEEDEDQEVVVVKCGHAFHKPCLMEWKNSSKQMSCPECRTKYTARTLTKLFLNVLPKDENAYPNEILDQLQVQQSQSATLQRDKERLTFEKQQMEFELLKSKNDYLHLMTKSNEVSRSYAIKCEEFSLVNGVNDEYLKANKKLNEENEALRRQLQNVKQELTDVKIKQMRTSKPFVDLTRDENSDDSDIEIVEAKSTKPKSENKSSDVIVLEEETAQDIAEQNVEVPTNDTAMFVEDKKPAPQLLDSWDFILEQIGTFRNGYT